MTKREAANYYRRLCRCINTRKFRIKLKTMPADYGIIEWGDIDDIHDTIFVDPRRRSPFIRTIIHEILHAVDYSMSDTVVLNIEKELFKTLSDRQLNGLLKRVMAHDLDMAS